MGAYLSSPVRDKVRPRCSVAPAPAQKSPEAARRPQAALITGGPTRRPHTPSRQLPAHLPPTPAGAPSPCSPHLLTCRSPRRGRMTTTSLASRPCRAGGQTWCVAFLCPGAQRGVGCGDAKPAAGRQRWIPDRGARSRHPAGSLRRLTHLFALFASGRWLQEDAHAAVLDLEEGNSKAALFAVLDGHGGAEVARFAAKHLVSERASE